DAETARPTRSRRTAVGAPPRQGRPVHQAATDALGAIVFVDERVYSGVVSVGADAAALALLTVAELPRIGERRLLRLQERARRRHLPLAGLADLPAAALREEFNQPAAAVARWCGERARHEAR